MKYKIFTTISIFLFMPHIFYAQSNINISVGGGYLVSSNSADKLQYWSNGYSVNLFIEYFLKDNFSISLNSSYQNHFYDEGLLQLTVPDVLGYRFTVDGENSRTYDASLKNRIYISSSFVRPFISLGVGVLFIEQGNVVKTSWMEGNEDSKNTYSLKGSNNNYFAGQFSVGSGIQIALNDYFEMLIEGYIVNIFNSDLVYFPITTSIKFAL